MNTPQHGLQNMHQAIQYHREILSQLTHWYFTFPKISEILLEGFILALDHTFHEDKWPRS